MLDEAIDEKGVVTHSAAELHCHKSKRSATLALAKFPLWVLIKKKIQFHSMAYK
jgi:hypothetical protein